MPAVKVLFIEDDRMNRRVVKDMLDVAGATLTEAGDGELGLALIEANAFDLVLLDLRMPGMDGMEVMAHIRARTDKKARLPIIIVTADTAPGLKDRCQAAGADDVIFKPVAMETLFNAIGHVLARDVQRGGLID